MKKLFEILLAKRDKLYDKLFSALKNYDNKLEEISKKYNIDRWPGYQGDRPDITLEFCVLSDGYEAIEKYQKLKDQYLKCRARYERFNYLVSFVIHLELSKSWKRYCKKIRREGYRLIYNSGEYPMNNAEQYRFTEEFENENLLCRAILIFKLKEEK